MLRRFGSWTPVSGEGGGGATDHGELTGLADDDHAQYHNNTRGDARYSQLGHTHSIANVTGLQTALDGLAGGSDSFFDGGGANAVYAPQNRNLNGGGAGG
jgi:hypothetical protein